MTTQDVLITLIVGLTIVAVVGLLRLRSIRGSLDMDGPVSIRGSAKLPTGEEVTGQIGTESNASRTTPR
jgi:hypothetical protein